MGVVTERLTRFLGLHVRFCPLRDQGSPGRGVLPLSRVRSHLPLLSLVGG